MYNHNKAQQSKNRVHISWDILYTQIMHVLCALLNFLWIRYETKSVEMILQVLVQDVQLGSFVTFNTFRSEQNDQNFADVISKCVSLKLKVLNSQ